MSLHHLSKASSVQPSVKPHGGKHAGSFETLSKGLAFLAELQQPAIERSYLGLLAPQHRADLLGAPATTFLPQRLAAHSTAANPRFAGVARHVLLTFRCVAMRVAESLQPPSHGHIS
mmetsp:Transcript_20383/g.37084  ORF Transcript_20383/g.37084 Transcript_20383/m.37084 type:complete len:117 (+) Transcript_20383:1104-1454(+)